MYLFTDVEKALEEAEHDRRRLAVTLQHQLKKVAREFFKKYQDIAQVEWCYMTATTDRHQATRRDGFVGTSEVSGFDQDVRWLTKVMREYAAAMRLNELTGLTLRPGGLIVRLFDEEHSECCECDHCNDDRETPEHKCCRGKHQKALPDSREECCWGWDSDNHDEEDDEDKEEEEEDDEQDEDADEE